jgi:hypothetical protein
MATLNAKLAAGRDPNAGLVRRSLPAPGAQQSAPTAAGLAPAAAAASEPAANADAAPMPSTVTRPTMKRHNTGRSKTVSKFDDFE